MDSKAEREQAPDPREADPLRRKPLAWMLLVVVSALLAFLFDRIGLPAALLLGPMLAAALFALRGQTLRLAQPPYLLAQALIGTMAAGAVSGGIVPTFLTHWPWIIAIVLTVIAASTLSGFVLSRLKILPGTTAIWGSSAGAATSMLVMADAYGADIRLVAFMQYLRVVFVAGAAALVARFWAETGSADSAIDWLTPLPAGPFAMTLAVAAIGALAGRALRLPAGLFMGPFILTAILSSTGYLHVVLPELLMALCYALLGWRIGLGFTRDIIVHARRALMPTIGSILFLMAISAGLATLLTIYAGIDPLTAYLATSPGGLDSIAIIAAHSNVDLAFVMALQTARLLLIMACGPLIARFIANRV